MRLSKRTIRPLTVEETEARDNLELESLGMKDTLEHAEVRINNDGDLMVFKDKIQALIR